MTETPYLLRLEVVLTRAAAHDVIRAPRRRFAEYAVGFAVVVAAVSFYAAAPISRTRPAAAAISVADDGTTITILLLDVETNAAEVERQIRAAGVDVEITAVAASPSVVSGRIGAFYSSEGAPELEEIDRDGQFFKGFRVPKNSTARLELFVARPARSGESYEIGADAYAPGEVLGCSGLYGKQVRAARAQLDALGVTINWLRVNQGADVTEASIDEVLDLYVTDATPTSAKHLTIYVTNTGRSAFLKPLSDPTKYRC